jgi:hypothetical protein
MLRSIARFVLVPLALQLAAGAARAQQLQRLADADLQGLATS